MEADGDLVNGKSRAATACCAGSRVVGRWPIWYYPSSWVKREWLRWSFRQKWAERGWAQGRHDGSCR